MAEKRKTKKQKRSKKEAIRKKSWRFFILLVILGSLGIILPDDKVVTPLLFFWAVLSLFLSVIFAIRYDSHSN